jgi:hypothetical protein
MASSHSKLMQHFDNNNAMYENLFQFIKKNTAIPLLINEMKSEDPALLELSKAVKEGNPKATIFSDPKCYIYLLRLIKDKEIAFWEGMTIFAYLLALIQFTENQPIKEIDKDVKSLRNISIDVLVQEEKLTVIGEKFLKSTKEQLKKIGYEISYEDLEKFVLKLPPAEQWLIKIPYDSRATLFSMNAGKNFNDTDRLLGILAPQIRFIMYDNLACWVPSYSFINHILQTISPVPIQMVPQFGSVSMKKLQEMHSQGQHPVALYGLDVLSNPYDADKYRCGPFVMWLHDIGHVFWGTMLGHESRCKLIRQFIPDLEELANKAKKHGDKEAAELLETAIRRAWDFDLTGGYVNPKTRLTDYMANTFGPDHSLFPKHLIEFEPIGKPAQDRVFFLLYKLFYHLKKHSEEWEMWNGILNVIQVKTGMFYRENKIINSLKILAEHSTNIKQIFCVVDRCDWEKRLEIFNTSNDDIKPIWEGIFKNQMPNELNSLILSGELTFFHPYIPLLPEQIASYKEFLKEKSNSQKLQPAKPYSISFGSHHL